MKNAQISYDKDQESNVAEGKASIGGSSQQTLPPANRQGSMYTKFILFKDDDEGADLRTSGHMTEVQREEEKEDDVDASQRDTVPKNERTALRSSGKEEDQKQPRRRAGATASDKITGETFSRMI